MVGMARAGRDVVSRAASVLFAAGSTVALLASCGAFAVGSLGGWFAAGVACAVLGALAVRFGGSR